MYDLDISWKTAEKWFDIDTVNNRIYSSNIAPVNWDDNEFQEPPPARVSCWNCEESMLESDFWEAKCCVYCGGLLVVREV